MQKKNETEMNPCWRALLDILKLSNFFGFSSCVYVLASENDYEEKKETEMKLWRPLSHIWKVAFGFILKIIIIINKYPLYYEPSNAVSYFCDVMVSHYQLFFLSAYP